MKKVFAVLLALVMALAMLPAQKAQADGTYSITGHYVSSTGTGTATFTVGERCPVCQHGILCARYLPSRGANDPAAHGIVCDNSPCAATMYEECSGGTATCTASAKCDVCGNPYGSKDPDNHPADQVTPATCVSQAYCDACKQYFGGTNPDNHVSVEPIQEPLIPATCTTPGREAGTRCEACLEFMMGGGEIPIDPDAHDLVHHDAKASTCMEIGWEAYDTCSRCDYTTYEEIPALGHTLGEPVRENEVPAQVGVAGSYDEVVYCAVCEAELSREQKAIPALEPAPEPEIEPEPEVAPDLLTIFCESLAYDILTAPENGVVEMDADFHPGLQREVLAALAQRPDVTLILTCRLNGEPAELTIPAGSDLLEQMGPADWLTFEEIAELLG